MNSLSGSKLLCRLTLELLVKPLELIDKDLISLSVTSDLLKLPIKLLVDIIELLKLCSHSFILMCAYQLFLQLLYVVSQFSVLI